MNNITISTWNVNSVRSRLIHLTEYLKSEKSPEVILLQEIKCEENVFPKDEIEDLGYNIAISGQKSYNGVAILSKFPIEDISISMKENSDLQTEARYIESVISAPKGIIRVCNVYVPNGQSPESEKFTYKLNFLEDLKQHIKTLLSYKEKLIVGGDYNIAPDNLIDSWDPKLNNGNICCHPLERKKFYEIINLGLTDIYRSKYPNKQEFTWWDYRKNSWEQNKGLRIDHLLLSPEASDCVKDVEIISEIRNKEKTSDHAPISCTLSL